MIFFFSFLKRSGQCLDNKQNKLINYFCSSLIIFKNVFSSFNERHVSFFLCISQQPFFLSIKSLPFFFLSFTSKLILIGHI